MNAISLPHDPELTAWLARRAASHGVSPAEEAAAILRAQKAREGSGDRAAWAAVLANPIAPKPGPDSTLLLRAARRGR